MSSRTSWHKKCVVFLLMMVAPAVLADPDVNDDGVVNNLDFALLRDCFLQDIEIIPSCNRVDQNSDSLINFLDVPAFQEFFLRFYPAPDASFELYPNLIVPIEASEFAAVSDFSMDGLPDLLGISSFPESKVSVANGRGDGTFEQPLVQYINCPIDGYELSEGQLVDLNGDGALDLAVICSLTFVNEFVTLLINEGSGSFSLGDSYSIDGFDNILQLADINNDSVMDLLAAKRGSFDATNFAHVFRNNGDETLTQFDFESLPMNTRSTTFADADGDGFADLLAVTKDFFNANTGPLFFLKGDGSGSFQPAELIDPDISARWINVADINEDQSPDVISCCFPSTSFLLGEGSGVFSPRVDFPGLAQLDFIGFTDLNQDQHLDVLSSNSDGVLGYVQFFPNGSPGLPPFNSGLIGSVGALTSFGTQVQPLMSDVNADGYPDLLSRSIWGVQVKELLENPQGPAFALNIEEPEVTLVDIDLKSIDLADVNGDGVIDIVGAGVSGISINADTTLVTMLGQNDGTFTVSTSSVHAGNLGNMMLSDLNSDGTLDAVVAHRNNDYVGIYTGTGGGHFEFDSTLPGGGREVVTAQLNEDGFTDLITSAFFDNEILVYSTTEAGEYTLTQTIAAESSVLEMRVADINLDGRSDLIFRGLFELFVYLNNGEGQLVPTNSVVIRNANDDFSSSESFEVGHLDDDAFIDIAVGMTANQLTSPAGIQLFKGIGDGTFERRAAFDMPPPLGSRVPQAIHIEDVNADGLPDLIAQDDFEEVTFIYLAVDHYEFNKVQKYGPLQTASPGLSFGGSAVQDINSDGKPDIIQSVVGGNSSSVSVLVHE